jgi:hypothetical protein
VLLVAPEALDPETTATRCVRQLSSYCSIYLMLVKAKCPSFELRDGSACCEWGQWILELLINCNYIVSSMDIGKSRRARLLSHRVGGQCVLRDMSRPWPTRPALPGLWRSSGRQQGFRREAVASLYVVVDMLLAVYRATPGWYYRDATKDALLWGIPCETLKCCPESVPQGKCETRIVLKRK